MKIGVIAEMTGAFAEFGYQFQTAISAYMKRHGSKAGDKTIEVIYRDVGGPNPDVAKRLAQELITRDKVSFLAGFGFSPNALSVAPLATQAKVPMVVMNAQAVGLPSKSPYIVRTSTTAAESADVMGQWAAKNRITTAVSLVIDYSPGRDAEEAFAKSFTAQGGQIVNSLRVPLSTIEFGPYLQRVKDAKPQALFAFVNGGQSGVSFFNALNERGLMEAGIKILGTGDLTFEPVLDAMPETPAGIITAYPYSPMHSSVENNLFVSDFMAAGDGKMFPCLFAVSAYDGMAAIYEAVRKAKDTSSGEAFMPTLKSLKLKSPRGPLAIDQSGEAKQVIYIRRTERQRGRVVNMEFDQFTK